MWERKSLITFLVFSMVLSSVHALSFSTQLEAVNDKITLSQVAEYSLTIFNHENTEERFRVKVADYPRWDIFTQPRINPLIVKIEPNGNATIQLFLDPNANYLGPIGSHFVNLNVISESSGEESLLQPTVGLVSETENILTYVPTVIVTNNFPDKINPSNEFDFRVTLVNQNNLDIKGATLILSSPLFLEELTMDIGPKEKKEVDIKKILDPKTPPSEETLTISLMYEDKNVFSPIQKRYEIISYSQIEDQTIESKSILVNKKSITFTNKGNVEFNGDLRIKTNFLNNIFTSTIPKAQVQKEDGDYYLVWTVNLAPQESISLSVTENYLSVGIIILIAILLALFFYVNRSPMTLKKEISGVDIHEGGISKLTVMLTIKNRGKEPLNDIKILDKIPKLFDINKHTTLGSLKPNKIHSNNKHETIIEWIVNNLSPGEERVINYSIKTHLKILGGLTLARGMCSFQGKDKEIKSKSNISFTRV